jgi:hypothetical protein
VTPKSVRQKRVSENKKESVISELRKNEEKYNIRKGREKEKAEMRFTMEVNWEVMSGDQNGSY